MALSSMNNSTNDQKGVECASVILCECSMLCKYLKATQRVFPATDRYVMLISCSKFILAKHGRMIVTRFELDGSNCRAETEGRLRLFP